MPSVLLIEDDPNVRRAFEDGLVSAGLRVIPADGVRIGWDLFCSEHPELVVLDLNLPDGSGLDVCRKIRGHKSLSHTPVIILTAKGELEDKAAGFETGADQYLVKPLRPKELLLWVQALLRRVKYEEEDERGGILCAAGCEINVPARMVTFNSQPVAHLTNREFDLLYFLVKRRPQVLSRKYLLSNLWHTVIEDHVVNTHVNNLRHKLPRALADHIQTVPGKGFRFIE